MAKRIYLDYASLTPIDRRVISEMNRYSSADFANPSSLYKEGTAAKKALDGARKGVTDFIHAHPDEMTFTSGGTEANNLAIIGAVESLHEKGVEYKDMHVLVSAIEHSSVIECLNHLNGKEVATDTVGVDARGVIILDELKKKIRPNTVIVSVMMVNNEIGTIQPIRDIAKIIRQARTDHFNFQDFKYPIFHTDAAQAALYYEINVEKLGVDLLTLDGSKAYGPRGIGALYMKRGVPIAPIIYGGGQEKGLRSGTESIPAIMGFAKALEIAAKERDREVSRISQLKGLFIDGLRKIRPGTILNPIGGKHVPAPLRKNDHFSVIFAEGGETQSPHILNISIPGIQNEYFILRLDAHGVACSTKSSCLRDEAESYVLKAIGADSGTSIRFSFGRWTKKGDIRRVLALLAKLC